MRLILNPAKGLDQNGMTDIASFRIFCQCSLHTGRCLRLRCFVIVNHLCSFITVDRYRLLYKAERMMHLSFSVQLELRAQLRSSSRDRFFDRQGFSAAVPAKNLKNLLY